MNKIIRKKYYRIKFSLASPMSIGSGKNAHTDKDIVCDAQGKPYIPASSLAGVYREQFDEEIAKKYFGYIAQFEEDVQSSALIIYDAYLTENSERRIIERDMVALDEYKTGIPGAKFDTEALETGAEFVTYIEQNYYSQDDEDCAREIVQFWKDENICLGGKTMRGYGKTKVISIQEAEFDLSNKTDAKKWIEFDMYGDGEWKETNIGNTSQSNLKKIVIELKQKRGSGISIRKYTTEVSKDGKNNGPDFESITIREKTPVIPGTTWAGAIRSHMEKLCPEIKKLEYFGTTKQKSKIGFSESMIEGTKSKVMTRTAIDRFTAGASDTGLFTEKTYYGGTTKLEISFKEELEDSFAKTLAATIADLHYGILSVGGLTSIGRGLFDVISINGEQVAEDLFLQAYKTISNKKENEQ